MMLPEKKWKRKISLLQKKMFTYLFQIYRYFACYDLSLRPLRIKGLLLGQWLASGTFSIYCRLAVSGLIHLGNRWSFKIIAMVLNKKRVTFTDSESYGCKSMDEIDPETTWEWPQALILFFRICLWRGKMLEVSPLPLEINPNDCLLAFTRTLLSISSTNFILIQMSLFKQYHDTAIPSQQRVFKYFSFFVSAAFLRQAITFGETLLLCLLSPSSHLLHPARTCDLPSPNTFLFYQGQLCQKPKKGSANILKKTKYQPVHPLSSKCQFKLQALQGAQKQSKILFFQSPSQRLQVKSQTLFLSRLFSVQSCLKNNGQIRSDYYSQNSLIGLLQYYFSHKLIVRSTIFLRKLTIAGVLYQLWYKMSELIWWKMMAQFERL